MPYRFLFGLIASLSVFACTASAQDEIILQVSDAATSVELSLADLDAMSQVTFETTTIWTNGVVTFSGVSLKALLETLGTNGDSIEMIALNDYSVTMPVSELATDAPIIATRMNGDVMSVRDKGPYWVVFPYDADPRLRTETVYSRSIWQLNRLVVSAD
ncbi:molybdopterin-dependent oxidoreductase [Octadecabacter ascidiaceicola]|uniref:Oxidoreductase molybdopterin binding domain protein n=1 Tax=Octadecabacter ascidiaceicola TaxID=1655543 RepID=A0A238K825_9RHOB|nr:molybdopterin-dependent oxidoreductase [Octadecabacter ascidiaceicola]SMX38242.1 Oxidoreductase molybdopterin binding domain protein [Octadecabacter ascidiaceicola]